MCTSCNGNDCDKFYIGQTGRKFIDRFKEHLPKKNISSTKSNLAFHLINKSHNYTRFAENMKPVHFYGTGRYMDALKEFELYKATKFHQEQLLNAQLSCKSNIQYDAGLHKSKEDAKAH